MFLTKPYRCSIIKCIIVCYTTSINASQYEDIDPDFQHQDVLICEKNEISRASAYEAISSSLNYTDAGLNEMDYFIDK